MGYNKLGSAARCHSYAIAEKTYVGASPLPPGRARVKRCKCVEMGLACDCMAWGGDKTMSVVSEDSTAVVQRFGYLEPLGSLATAAQLRHVRRI